MDAGLLILLLVVVAGGCAWFAWWSYKRKIERYTAHATQIGFDYTSHDRSFLREWRGMPFESSGRNRDIFSGQVRGTPLHVFEHTYEQRIDDKNTVSVQIVVAAARIPRALPETRILHETTGAKLTKLFGAQDIQFESSTFNDAFLVKGADERASHALIDPRMMEFLLNSPARDFQIRMVGSWVLMWQPESAFRFEKMRLPEAVEPMAELITQFIERIPGHLLRPGAGRIGE